MAETKKAHVSSAESSLNSYVQLSAASRIPAEWVIKHSKTKGGKVYYYNTVTGVSTWRLPKTHPGTESEPLKPTKCLGEPPRKATKRPAANTNTEQGSSTVDPVSLKKSRHQVTPSDYAHLSQAEREIIIKYPQQEVHAASESAGEKLVRSSVEFPVTSANANVLNASGSDVISQGHVKSGISQLKKRRKRRKCVSSKVTNGDPENWLPQDVLLQPVAKGEAESKMTPVTDKITRSKHAVGSAHSTIPDKIVNNTEVPSVNNTEVPSVNNTEMPSTVVKRTEKRAKKKKGKKKKRGATIAQEEKSSLLKVNDPVASIASQGQASSVEHGITINTTTSQIGSSENQSTKLSVSPIPNALVFSGSSGSVTERNINLTNNGQDIIRINNSYVTERSSSPLDNELSSIFNKTQSNNKLNQNSFGGSGPTVPWNENITFSQRKCISPLLREEIIIGDSKKSNLSNDIGPRNTASSVFSFSLAPQTPQKQNTGSSPWIDHAGEQVFKETPKSTSSPIQVFSFSTSQNNSGDNCQKESLRSSFGYQNVTNSPLVDDINRNKLNVDVENVFRSKADLNDGHRSSTSSPFGGYLNQKGEISSSGTQSSTSSPNFFQGSSHAEAAEEQDIEDMDVDEEGVQILSSLQDVRVQTASLLDKPGGVLTETVTKTHPVNRSVDSADSSAPQSQQIVLVIDTNVLIASLRFVKDAQSYNIPGHGKPLLVLPWRVMQELDYLKNGKGNINDSKKVLAQRAAEAVRFIHSQLLAKNPFLVGQTPQENIEDMDFQRENNDDDVLQCCLQCKKKYPGSRVILLTRDLSLTNKTLIMGLQAANTETLWKLLKVPETNYRSRQKCMLKDIGFRPIKDAEMKSQPSKTEKPCDGNIRPSPSPRFGFSLDRNGQVNRLQIAKPSPVILAFNEKTPTLVVDKEMKESKECGGKEESALELEEADSAAFNKFQSVWKLIYDIKVRVNAVLVGGKTHPNYGEAIQMLETIRPLLKQLKENFERCLSISPIIIRERMDEFNTLSVDLNTFFTRTHVPSPDPSKPVQPSQLMNHFHGRKNRPTLSSGMDQLISFISDFDKMSQQSC